MKPFTDLTEIGQRRRLRTLAMHALEAYDLVPIRVRLLSQETNTMFRVDAEDGERYVLRIYSPEDTILEDNQVEIYWLRCILRDTDLKVTEPVPRRDGTFINRISVQGAPGERRCVLFRWAPGRALEEQLSLDAYTRFGAIMAQLHEHAASLTIPTNLRPKRWDRVFYYPDEPVVYNRDAYQHLFPRDLRGTMDAVVERANNFLQDLHQDEAQRMLIHGDMHHWNVHLYKDELYVIDFEDAMLGYPLQDIAITFYYGQDHAQFQAFCDAFEEGYSSLRPWPVEEQGQLETLWAARKAMFINYVARIWPDPVDFIERGCRYLQDYLTR